MTECLPNQKKCHIGFVSTRFEGTDGVTLETAKWSKIFEKMGFSCFYFAGELDLPSRCSYLVEKAHFKHPDIRELYQASFGTSKRHRRTTDKIYAIKQEIKEGLYAFIRQFDIDLLVPENALTIPLNIPLGIAITEVISETGMPAIAHHHDFFWERKQFLTNAVWEFLNMAFPPHLPSIYHVVINSSADDQLSLRTGISATIIPNVMDFENPPSAPDDYAKDIRKDLGIEDDELFILQPTRVVQRKGIEHAIELVSRLDMKAKLVISHASGDEGYAYEQRVREYSQLMKVDTVFVSEIINDQRGTTATGQKIYTLEDIYPLADLVTYTSNFEGFGNAFLEAIYYGVPILVNTYSIYAIDIKPKGFSVIEIDGYVTDEAVAQTRKVLTDHHLRDQMVTHNYATARRHYSYTILQRKLTSLLMDSIGHIHF